LRASPSCFPQEPVLLAGSVADAIRYGAPDASMERVRAAAMAANAHDFIQALPLVGAGIYRLARSSNFLSRSRTHVSRPLGSMIDAALRADVSVCNALCWLRFGSPSRRSACKASQWTRLPFQGPYSVGDCGRTTGFFGSVAAMWSPGLLTRCRLHHASVI
jgi:hypothetical protein